MKILVFSDSHGHKNKIATILQREKDCSHAFFLGDGLTEVESIKEDYPHIKFITVKGNNDFNFDADKFAYAHIDGVTVMATHGDTLGVRVSLYELLDKARSVRANLALYGHTHVQNMYNDGYTGVCAVNPGALCLGQYCLIETDKGSFEIYNKNV